MHELFGGDWPFDVIIENLPYQLGSDGVKRDVPLYNRFVVQVKALLPRYGTMVSPSRWMASELGLTALRETMLADRRIRSLTDFPATSDLFPSVEVKAGVCFFLLGANHDGECHVTAVRGSDIVGPISRRLNEHDAFVR